VVSGTTENFLLCINITSDDLLILHLDAKYSVTPIFFEILIKFLFIGQFIIAFALLFFTK